ncbi:hypothetical protein CTA1_4398 [Colletotrichum tanaceti]|uniref:Uncharacterized protein n=1 Tax=Colletotrichum tanaceti TaxID=1306861 RepID=A0A4U6X3Q6_9PEZI|nr:hypothetical protein CTA1_4398 [Colletotrichum tanaceti]
MPIDKALRMELDEMNDGSQDWKKTEMMLVGKGTLTSGLVIASIIDDEADVGIAKWANRNPIKPPRRIAAGERSSYREASVSSGEEQDAIHESHQQSDDDYSCKHEWDDGITLPSNKSDAEHDPETIADYNDDLSGQESYAQI